MGSRPKRGRVLQRAHRLGAFSVVSVENVGPQIGSELRTRGLLAVVLSLLGMMAYIWWRFEFRFGVGAMIASAHDVMVTLGVYALLGYEFNLTTIAAFLTLIGYSVNDTVVIFDRVRENMRKPKRLPLTQVINEGINETLSRTIMTAAPRCWRCWRCSWSAARSCAASSFVLLFGIIIGTYSTIYIASAMVLFWEGRQAAKDSAKPRRRRRRPRRSTATRPKTSPRRSSV